MLRMHPDPIVVKGVLLFLTENGAFLRKFQAEVLDYILKNGLINEAPATYFLPNTALCCLQSFLKEAHLTLCEVHQLYELSPQLLPRMSTAETERWLDCLTTSINSLEALERPEAQQDLARLATFDGDEASLIWDLRLLACVVKAAKPSRDTYQVLEPCFLRAILICKHCFSASVMVASAAYFTKTLFWVLGGLVKSAFPALAESLLSSPNFPELSVIEAFSAGVNALGREEECRDWLQVNFPKLLQRLMDILTTTEDYEVAGTVFLILTHALWSAPLAFPPTVVRDTFHGAEILFRRLNSRNSHEALIGYLTALYTFPLAPEALTADLTQLLLDKLPIINSHIQSKTAALVAAIRGRFPTAFQMGVSQARLRGLLGSLSPAAQTCAERSLLTAACPAGQMKALLAALSLVLTHPNSEDLLFQLPL